ncbi:mechanosensitive ion channel [Persicobacter diffluens]|uniref:Mechanosensitive ion channel protein MscS n=1 Tax=Persicobacter diffluens TaxID=981 RepID=A0AAN4W560_9BACT|nr:hypothetical protein PEDI_48620 [Persicobacter diffluens]
MRNLQEPINKVMAKLDSWLDAFVTMLPNMAIAVLLFVFFYLLAKYIKKFSNKLLNKTIDNRVLENLLATIIYYTVLGSGFFIILGILGLEKTVTSLLAGVGVIGIALGFAFQDISANFISGIILAFKTPFRIGDVVELNGIMGTVEKTTIRVTIVQTFQGQEVHIPNKDVMQNPIYNYSKLGKRRIDLSVGVSYNDNLKEVESVVLNCIKKLEGVVDPDNIIFDYYEFGDSSINFMIRFWIKFPGPPELGFLELRKKAIISIKQAFDEHEITIPFPIRTLEFNPRQLSSSKEEVMEVNA